jgi:hypothetical protein
VRKLNQREKVLLGVVGVAALALLVLRFARHAGPIAPATTRPRSAAAVARIERIDLARLDTPLPATDAGRRNLFAFGAIPTPEPEVPIFVATPPPAPVTASVAATADATPPPPSLPPLNLRFIGAVESASGVKAAVLITDRKEVLTGAAGQVIANRYRIARIGLESVDLEDVSNGQARRIPLRGQ